MQLKSINHSAHLNVQLFRYMKHHMWFTLDLLHSDRIVILQPELFLSEEEEVTENQIRQAELVSGDNRTAVAKNIRAFSTNCDLVGCHIGNTIPIAQQSRSFELNILSYDPGSDNWP